MSTSTDRPQKEGLMDSDEGEQEDKRIADPENYNLSRRLRQLHDAKESVVEIKDRAVNQEAVDSNFSPSQRDQFVAEKLIDYIRELRPLMKLRENEDDFLNEEVGTVGGQELTLRQICETHGQVEIEDGQAWIPYQVSMTAWDLCNDYMEQIAGGTFETQGLPTDEGFDSTA